MNASTDFRRSERVQPKVLKEEGYQQEVSNILSRIDDANMDLVATIQQME